MSAVTKVEVQDYTDTLVRILVERGEEAPQAVILSKADLPSPSVSDGQLTRSRADMDATIRAVVGVTVQQSFPDDLGIEYASSLRVGSEPEKAPPRR